MNSPSNPLISFVSALEAQSELSAADRQLVLDLPHRLRQCDAGGYLVRDGDVPEQCSVLVEGFAFRQKLTGEGTRQILSICIPGDAVDLQNLFLGISDHSIQLLTRAVVAEIAMDVLQELVLNRSAIGTAVIQQSLIEASILREWVVNIGRRDARSRIAHLLCEFAVRLEQRGLDGKAGFELPMTQEQIADATGLTPVHVNRVLRTLEAEGLIARQRRRVCFPDWRALQDVGDFSRRYLHMSDADVLVEA